MKPVSTILSVFMILSSSLHSGPVPDVAHLVSIEDLRAEISDRNVKRAGNIREIQSLLRHPEVQKLGHLFDLEKIEIGKSPLRAPSRTWLTWCRLRI